MRPLDLCTGRLLRAEGRFNEYLDMAARDLLSEGVQVGCSCVSAGLPNAAWSHAAWRAESVGIACPVRNPTVPPAWGPWPQPFCHASLAAAPGGGCKPAGAFLPQPGRRQRVGGQRGLLSDQAQANSHLQLHPLSCLAQGAAGRFFGCSARACVASPPHLSGNLILVFCQHCSHPTASCSPC